MIVSPMRPHPALRRLVAGLAALMLSACVVMQEGAGKGTREERYSTTELFRLDDQESLWLVHHCDDHARRCSAPPQRSVTLEDSGWRASHTAQVRRQPPHSLPDADYMDHFERPLSASATAGMRFVGIFEHPRVQTFVWLLETAPGSTGSGALRHFVSIEGPRNDGGPPAAPGTPAIVPALVVRDGNAILVFAQVRGECPPDRCLTVAEVAGVDPDTLPVVLRGRLAVFHADLVRARWLRRVMRDPPRGSQWHVRLQPWSAKPWRFDMRTVPRLRLAHTGYDTVCEFDLDDNRATIYAPLLDRGIETGRKKAEVPRGCRSTGAANAALNGIHANLPIEPVSRIPESGWTDQPMR